MTLSLGKEDLTYRGGQKQRIAIARAMIKRPSIILLDEATSALDNVSEGKVQVALQNLLKNKTTITIAHRLSTIEHYDKIIVMEQGKIVEAGTYKELLHNKRNFHQLVYGSNVQEGM
ncbi:ATP-binding cassette domain-containing protein [Lederbergia sp. NSJ-179]|nr:ATP-binding cassette domain-containing protein [Lederbergia sp. NSJ-179]